MQQKTVKRCFGWYSSLILLMVLARSQDALATPPRTPITLDFTLSHAPGLSDQAIATVTVQSIFDALDTSVELILPDGAVAQTQTWVIDLRANVPVTYTGWIAFHEPGNQTVSARALKKVDAGVVWGEMKSIPLYISPTAAPSARGWRVEQTPVASLAAQGDTNPISMQPTPFSFSTSAAVPSPGILPSLDPSQLRTATPQVPSSPGIVTLTGKWEYHDRSNVSRNIDQQLIEIRSGNGTALSPRVFCFTEVDGTFSCSFNHPGSTMRVWVRSWTNFNREGGADRLGVFSGIEIPGGCGSDSIDCSYAVQTGEITCADGAVCNIGTWTVHSTITGEPFLGAHQMTQDLIRSWKKIFFDPKHGTRLFAGPGRITYPVPAGHGTHAHVVGNFDGWISIEPPNQQSGDVVNHEYGHVVMSNLWVGQGFVPNWPTQDCTSPHFIQLISGPGCALSEGFANFWTIYSNEFYDGTNNPANYGPIWNFAGGASTNLETRDGGTYQAGDQVEGNVAAAMWDLHDTANESPTGVNADNLSDGIQHIWHTTSSGSDNNFAQWWEGYLSNFDHNRCHALGILRLNTINYESTCAELLVQSITTSPVSSIAGQRVDVTVTIRNQGTAAGGPFFVDWYANRTTAPLPLEVGQVSCNIAALAVGATTTCTGTFTYVAPGTFQMWAQVDTDQQVSETNENNNIRGPQPLVVSSPMLLTLTASPTMVSAGGVVNGGWMNLSPSTPSDWIGLFAEGSSDSAFLNWVYAGSCSQTPGSPPLASGSCPLAIPIVAPGTYRLRIFANDGFTRLAESNAFTVTQVLGQIPAR